MIESRRSLSLRRPQFAPRAIFIVAGCCLLAAVGCDSDPVAKSPVTPDASALLSDEDNAPEFELADVDPAEADALHALGYISEVGGPAKDQPVGVLLNDPDRVRQGIDYITVAGRCSAHIARPDGEILRKWSRRPCTRWENGFLTPAGELYVIHDYPVAKGGTLEMLVDNSTSLLKFDWEGNLLWENDLPAHHDVGPTPDGNVAVLIKRLEVFPSFDESIPVKDHGIAIVSPQGEVLEQAWIYPMMERSTDVYTPIAVEPEVVRSTLHSPLIHSNSIHWMDSDALAEKDPFYSKDNVLITLRGQDTLLLINWPTKKIIWSWGHGELRGPHDGNVLENGNILVFDNGSPRRRSRVVELDPLKKEIVWEYSQHDFYSGTRSGAQRLPNGNTLVSVSDRAMGFEVTPEGELVWEYRNPIKGRGGKPAVIVRIRNYPPDADLRPTSLVD